MSSEQDSKTVVTSSGEPEREVKVGTHKNLRLQGTRWIPTAPGIFMARDGRFRGGSFPIDVLEQDGKLIAILPFNVHSVSACNNGEFDVDWERSPIEFISYTGELSKPNSGNISDDESFACAV